MPLPNLFPAPQQISGGKELRFAPLITINRPSQEIDIEAKLHGCGVDFSVVDNGDGLVTLVEDREAVLPHLPEGLSERKIDQAYTLVIERSSTEDNRPAVTITGSIRGLQHGLSTFKAILREGPVELEIVDWPDMAMRGVVEGFYGEPWPHHVRREMFSLLSDMKFSHFLFAPKNDQLHRYLWRDPYSREALDHFQEVVEYAASVGLTFGYALSPGLTLVHASEVDLAALTAKFDQMFEIGVRCFSILFDDITEAMTHPLDVEKFASQAEGQVYVTTSLWEHLQSKDTASELIFCPTHYSGHFLKGGDARDSEYLKTIANLPQGVEIIWSGPQICSKNLTSAYTDEISEVVGRPITYWDNYPVNDASMSQEMHLGPLEGRDDDLGGHAAGLFANPMSAHSASKIPLFTIGDFLWNGGAHDPWSAWDAGARSIYPAMQENLRVVANNLGRCCLRDDDSPRLMALVDHWMVTSGPAKVDALKAIESYFVRIREAVRRVGASLKYPMLAKELAHWLWKLDDCAVAGIAAVEAVQAGVGSASPEARLRLVETLERATVENTYKAMETVLSKFARQALMENENAHRSASDS